MEAQQDSFKHIIFGSHDSRDMDIFVEVPYMPKDFQKRIEVVATFRSMFRAYYPDKNIDINYGTVNDGIITECHKGLASITNNACYNQYAFHTQAYDNFITKELKIELDKKMVFNLKFLFEWIHQIDSLKNVFVETISSDFIDTPLSGLLDVYASIDFSKEYDYASLNLGGQESAIKTLYYPMFQNMAFFEGYNAYSKSELVSLYPESKKFLYRQKTLDFSYLNVVRDFLVEACKKPLVDTEGFFGGDLDMNMTYRKLSTHINSF